MLEDTPPTLVEAWFSTPAVLPSVTVGGTYMGPGKRGPTTSGDNRPVGGAVVAGGELEVGRTLGVAREILVEIGTTPCRGNGEGRGGEATNGTF